MKIICGILGVIIMTITSLPTTIIITVLYLYTFRPSFWVGLIVGLLLWNVWMMGGSQLALFLFSVADGNLENDEEIPAESEK